jgi:uncharacterized protein YcaQ
MVHSLSRREARRIAVRAQWLAAPRPAGLLDLVRHLTLLQVDLTAAVAPNAELICWSRLGSSFRPEELDALITGGSLAEFRGMLRPAEDIALFRAGMRAWPGRGPLKDWQVYVQDWVKANEACRQDILQTLRSEGPLPARELPDTCVVQWRSSGWTHHRNVMRLLEFMEARGEVAVSSRENRERVWDLASRVYPDSAFVPADRASALRDQRRLASLGIARGKSPQVPGEALDAGEAGEPAVIEGVRGTWRVDPAQLGQPFRGRAALLSPLDRLVMDRRRVAEIFEFDYQLEMYKPAAKRRWGYFALPVLYGDRLVGKLDAHADRRAGIFRIHALHQDVPFTAAMTTAVEREIRDLARWLQLHVEDER